MRIITTPEQDITPLNCVREYIEKKDSDIFLHVHGCSTNDLGPGMIQIGQVKVVNPGSLSKTGNFCRLTIGFLETEKQWD